MAQFLEGGIDPPMLEELQGTRCRLQRLRDLRFLSGWVRSALDQQITVELKGPVPGETGEQFNLEATTGEANVAYPCVLIEEAGSMYTLLVAGSALLTTPGQEPRYKAYQVDASLQGPEVSLRGDAVDISASGVGILSHDPLPRSAKVRVALLKSSLSVECLGTVRYCRPDQEQEGRFRLGIQVEFEDRLSRAMWIRLMHSACQAPDKAA